MFYVYKNIKMYIRGFICLVITKMPPLTRDEGRVVRFHGFVAKLGILVLYGMGCTFHATDILIFLHIYGYETLKNIII